MDFEQRLTRYKKNHNVLIAAHTYQSPPVQACADLIGDSYALAKKAAASTADTILVCGVRFMAEGIKILASEKTVILVEPRADCPMARQIEPERVVAFREQHPDYTIVAYINTTAELKAVCDVCVTSSSAVKIVRALPQKNILFIPDKNLGDYVRHQVPEKNIVTWDGFCHVHNSVTADDVRQAKALRPEAVVAMHPECPPEAVALADMVGSTAAIISYLSETDKPVIVATERGVVDKFSPDFPDRLIQLCPDKLICPNMKITSVKSLEAVMDGTGGEVIELSQEIMDAARSSLTNMLRYGG